MDLQEALTDKPPTCGPIIAQRAALRVVPIALAQAFAPGSEHSTRIARLFWVAARLDAGMKIVLRNPTRNALKAALRVSTRCAREAERVSNVVSLAALQTANSTVQAATSLQATAEYLEQVFVDDDALDYAESSATRPSENLSWMTKLATGSAGRAAAAAAGAASYDNGAAGAAEMWTAVSGDIAIVEQGGDDEILLRLPLWVSEPPWAKSTWTEAARRLKRSTSSFGSWVDWYERRLDGEARSFNLPSEQAETELNRRLIRMGDAWWSRADGRVNSEIEEWLGELGGDPQEPAGDLLYQNPLALQFEPTGDERFGLSLMFDRGPEELDADACDRHAEVLREAEAAVASSCHGVTQATDIALPLKDYIEAIGGDPSERRASLVILRGNKIRRLFDQRTDERSLAPPLSQHQTEALESFLAAHNLYVALDDKLTAIQQAGAPKGTPPISMTSDQMRAVIDTVESVDLLTEDAASSLRDAADNAAERGPTQEQNSRFAGESAGNLVRAVGKLVKAAKAVGSFGAGAIKSIRWVNENNGILSRIFAGSGWIRTILDWVSALKF